MAAITVSFLLRPLWISTTSTFLSKYPLRKPQFVTLPTPSLFSFSSSSLTTPSLTEAFTPTLSSLQLQDQDQDPDPVVENQIKESETEEEHKTEEEEVKLPLPSPLPVLNLTVKEKKELASYAHSLGTKLKSQLVGKSGVTLGVASSFIETLEANELLKIKIHRTCPGELEDVVKHLEEATGSVVVGQIGRTVIIYRPSLTKMKLEEKKREARRVYVRKESKLKPLLLKKAEASRLSGRGRRGTSRFSSCASEL